MFRRLTKTPTSFEFAVLKWIFLPVIAVAMGYVLINLTTDRHACKSICYEKGFSDYRYNTRGNAPSNSCFCLTEEESKLTRRIPKGTPVPIQ